LRRELIKTGMLKSHLDDTDRSLAEGWVRVEAWSTKNEYGDCEGHFQKAADVISTGSNY
jgi:hypothetical protein